MPGNQRYELRVKARDEHGASSGFSSTLTVVISEECGDFQGLQMCPLGQAVLYFGDELIISNIGDGDNFIDGVYPVGFDGTASGFTTMITINFENKGDVVIGMRGIDEFWGFGLWATLPVSVPKDKSINTMPLFLRFLENNPYLFPMLQQLLRL